MASSEIAQFGADLAALFEVIRDLPRRYFDGNIQEYSSALAIDPQLAELMLRGATGEPELYARADAYHDGEAFKLLELNVGSELGGIDAAQMNRGFLAAPAFRDFAAAHGLAFVDTAEIVAARLRAAGAQVGVEQPVVALLEHTGGIAAHEHVFVAIQEALRAAGIELLLGEVAQVDDRAGPLQLDGRRVDVVLRYYAAGEIAGDTEAVAGHDRVLRAHEAGRAVLVTPLESALYASKASLALLHEPAVRASFSPAERDLVDRVVPFTRRLGANPPGSRAYDELVERCRAQRPSLIIKPGVGYGAKGAVLGREVDDTTWLEALRSGAAADHVVQQVVVPASEPVSDPDSGEVGDWRANWGVFAIGDGYAGAFARALQVRDGSVISYANPGTRGGPVFTWGDGA